MSNAQPLADERRQQIRAHLIARGTVRTADLAAELGVSNVTVRRDLVDLQSRGEAIVVHGGARLAGGRVPPADRRERSKVEIQAKEAIARSAVGLVREGDTIFIDSGTTCAAMVPALSQLVGVTVITPDLSTATALAATAPQLPIVIAAGVVDPRTLSAVGELLPAVLRHFIFDITFISASAWSLPSGATTGALAYAAAKRSALARGGRSVLLADASKYGAAEAHVVQHLADFDSVITDDAVSPEEQYSLKSAGVNLLVASV